MEAPADELDLDNQLCFALYDASRAFTRAYAPILAGLGLTYPQYLVMLVLWSDAEPVAMSELGERLRLDSSTLTPLLKRLDQQGLLERHRDAADERRVFVTLTARGRALKNDASGIPARIHAASGLDPDDGRMMRDHLVRIARALER